MKKYLYTLLIIISSVSTVKAQKSAEFKALLANGNRAFIVVDDKNENTNNAEESFKKHLLGSEWNRWVLVDNKADANFICRLEIDKKGYNPMSFKSMGARVRTMVEIQTPEGKRIWVSKEQQGNVSEFTGGNALADAMRKVIRRSLKVELYGEKE